VQSGLACYTTGRFQDGRVRHANALARRLVRDAERLGLGAVDPGAAAEILRELGRAAFGNGPGVVRLQASCGADGSLRLLGLPRAIGPEPEAWSAGVSAVLHDGPAPWQGAKVAGHPRIAGAREAARAAGFEEALLFDAAGRLVEGSRTSLWVVLEDGRAVVPPLARGGVWSVARELASAGLGGLTEEDVERGGLARAREIVALNAVRGAVPVVRLDGRPVAAGAPGPLARRLREVLAGAE
jgi:branched-subunit amino acid aminotransferase/4-amino-4-deoxychorismate lyase